MATDIVVSESCLVCDGKGWIASAELHMAMQGDPCSSCKGTGKTGGKTRGKMSGKTRDMNSPEFLTLVQTIKDRAAMAKRNAHSPWTPYDLSIRASGRAAGYEECVRCIETRHPQAALHPEGILAGLIDLFTSMGEISNGHDYDDEYWEGYSGACILVCALISGEPL